MKNKCPVLYGLVVLFLLTPPAQAERGELNSTQLLTHDPNLFGWLHDGKFDKIPDDAWYNRQLGTILLGFTTDGCYSRNPALRRQIGRKKAAVLNMITKGEATDDAPDGLFALFPEILTMNTGYMLSPAFIKSNGGCNSQYVQQTLDNLIRLVIMRSENRDTVPKGRLKESKVVRLIEGLDSVTDTVYERNDLWFGWKKKGYLMDAKLLECRYSVGNSHLISPAYFFWNETRPDATIKEVQARGLDDKKRLDDFGPARSRCPETESEARSLIKYEVYVVKKRY